MTEREKSRAMLSTAALNIESYRIVARKSGNAIAEPRSPWFLVDDSHDTSPALSDFCFAARGAGGNSCQRSAESVGSRTTVLIDSHGFSVVHIVVPRVLVHVVLLVLIFCTILNDLNKWKKWKNQVNQVKGAGKFWERQNRRRAGSSIWTWTHANIGLTVSYLWCPAASYAGSNNPLSLKYSGLTKAYPRLWWLRMSLFAQPWSRRGMFVFHLVPSQWRK